MKSKLLLSKILSYCSSPKLESSESSPSLHQSGMGQSLKPTILCLDYCVKKSAMLLNSLTCLWISATVSFVTWHAPFIAPFNTISHDIVIKSNEVCSATIRPPMDIPYVAHYPSRITSSHKMEIFMVMKHS